MEATSHSDLDKVPLNFLVVNMFYDSFMMF